MHSLPAILAAAGTALAAAAGAASAHHSFAAQYDANKPITLTGTITKVEWTNPHTYFYLDVVDDRGKVVNWAVEGGAPNVLYREGWRPTSLKPGDKVTISGSRARDGSNLINATLFKMPDGRCLFAGTSGPGGTPTDNCTVGRR
jgi:DNA/RNA endonuclease YhcR with UshA esterase domain